MPRRNALFAGVRAMQRPDLAANATSSAPVPARQHRLSGTAASPAACLRAFFGPPARFAQRKCRAKTTLRV